MEIARTTTPCLRAEATDIESVSTDDIDLFAFGAVNGLSHVEVWEGASLSNTVTQSDRDGTLSYDDHTEGLFRATGTHDEEPPRVQRYRRKRAKGKGKKTDGQQTTKTTRKSKTRGKVANESDVGRVSRSNVLPLSERLSQLCQAVERTETTMSPPAKRYSEKHDATRHPSAPTESVRRSAANETSVSIGVIRNITPDALLAQNANKKPSALPTATNVDHSKTAVIDETSGDDGGKLIDDEGTPPVVESERAVSATSSIPPCPSPSKKNERQSASVPESIKIVIVDEKTSVSTTSESVATRLPRPERTPTTRDATDQKSRSPLSKRTPPRPNRPRDLQLTDMTNTLKQGHVGSEIPSGAEPVPNKAGQPSSERKKGSSRIPVPPRKTTSRVHDSEVFITEGNRRVRDVERRLKG